MSDPVLTYESRYQLDESGLSPDNLVQNEPHSLAQDRNRALAPLYGPFFEDSVTLVEASTGRTLLKGTHYSLVGLANMPSQRTGKPLYQVILVTDPAVLPNVTVTYQAIGGEYTFSAQTLVEMINTALVALPNGSYYDLINIPDDLEPTQHLHAVGDPIGFEYVTYILERIQQAILAGQMPAYRAILHLVEQQYGNSDARFTAILEQLFESAVTNLSQNATVPTYPIGGTLISTYCVGTTQMGKYHDGNGSFFNAPIALNSVSCGFVPSTPIGTLISSYCVGTTRMGTYSDGNGGTYNAVIELNSATCGYTGPDSNIDVKLNITSATMTVNAPRTISATLKGLLPLTQYKIFLTALHSSGIIGCIESNGEFTYDSPTAPGLFVTGGTTISSANTPSMTVTTDNTGAALANMSFTNRGNMPTGNWVLSAELAYGTNAAALKVQQFAFTVPTGEPTLVVAPGNDAKTVSISALHFPPNANFTLRLNWLNGTGEFSTQDLVITTNSSGSYSSTFTNSASSLYYYAWLTGAVSGAPNNMVSNIYTPDPRLFTTTSGGGNSGGPETPRLVVKSSAAVSFPNQAVNVSYILSGMTPGTEYLIYPTVNPDNSNPAFLYDGGGTQIVFSGFTDASGFAVITGPVNWNPSWTRGSYALGAQVRRQSDLAVVTPSTYRGDGVEYKDYGGASTVGLRVKNAAPIAQPTMNDYFDKTVDVLAKSPAPDAVELVLVYANLAPSMRYTGYLETPAGNVPIDFVTPEDTGADGNFDEGVSGVSPVLVTYATDAYAFDTDAHALAFIAHLTNVNLTSNRVLLDTTSPVEVTITPNDEEAVDGATTNFTVNATGLSAFGQYMVQMIIVNPYADTLVFPLHDAAPVTADANGELSLSRSFTAAVGTNVLVGFYQPRVRITPQVFAVTRPERQQVYTDNAFPKYSVRSATTYVDIAGLLSVEPPSA